MPAPVIATLELSYSYQRSDAASLDILYSYNKADPQISTLDIVSSYTAETTLRCPPLVGRWSNHTQRICNRLPQWHVGRHGENATNYQKLVNAFGIEAENIFNEMAVGKKNLYINTADAFQLYSSYRADLNIPLGDRRKHISSNLLFNSDFSLLGLARTELPYGWSNLKSLSTGSVRGAENGTNSSDFKQSLNDNVSGGRCVTLWAESGEDCYLHQQRSINISGNQNLTLSAWINAPVHEDVITGEVPEEFVSALYLAVLYADGTSDHIRTALPLTTNGYWKRVSTVLPVTKAAISATAMVALNVPIGGTTRVVCVDALQLELGSFATQWRDNAEDGPYWINTQFDNLNGPVDVHVFDQSATVAIDIDSNITNVITRPKHRLFFAEDATDFGDHAIPTRVTALDSIAAADLPATKATKKFGLKTDVIDKRSFGVKWRIKASDSSQIEAYLDDPKDIVGTYKIAERDLEQNLASSYGVPSDQYSNYTLEIRDFVIFNNRIWAFCYEAVQVNAVVKKYYTIKVISTDTYPSVPYLETIYDIGIGSTNSATLSIAELGGEFDFLAHVDGKSDQLIIGNAADSYYQMALEFDYYVLSEVNGQVVARHDYAGDLVMT